VYEENSVRKIPHNRQAIDSDRFRPKKIQRCSGSFFQWRFPESNKLKSHSSDSLWRSKSTHVLISLDYVLLCGCRSRRIAKCFIFKTSANPGCMFPEAFIASEFFPKVLSFATRECERESEHASSSKNFASTSKRALVLFLRAMRAKAKFCEHF